ncbi:MAG: hypothetical protein DMF18_08215 [Verrucomicrobia bacterium]|nr:MAG: hypothetical protein DMF18_08215 [Verrucomicrobiota bacterium]
MPQKIDRLAKARVLKLNSRDDDGVKFASNARCVAKICTDGIECFTGSRPVLTEGLLPALLHVRELTSARLIIRVFTVMILRVVDLLLAAPRGSVVRVERQDLFVFLESEIVTRGVVITVRVGQELFHFLNFFDECRAHRFVEVTGLLQMGEQLQRRPAIGIVAVLQNFTQNRLSFRKVAVGDPLLGDFHAALAETGQRFVVHFAGSDRIGEQLQRAPEFFMRNRVISRPHRRLRARQDFYTARQRRLAPLDFALGNPVDVLRENGRTKTDYNKKSRE